MERSIGEVRCSRSKRYNDGLLQATMRRQVITFRHNRAEKEATRTAYRLSKVKLAILIVLIRPEIQSLETCSALTTTVQAPVPSHPVNKEFASMSCSRHDGISRGWRRFGGRGVIVGKLNGRNRSVSSVAMRFRNNKTRGMGANKDCTTGPDSNLNKGTTATLTRSTELSIGHETSSKIPRY